jgi:succinate dehydrogenase / fumarate reductase membrane anchor subunit
MALPPKGYRTPLSRARGLGSAKHGVGHFIGQRSSAVALVFLLLWGVWSALKLAPLDYEGAAAWMRSPLHAALLLLLLATGFFHVRIGAQVIIEDYIHAPLTKTYALLANLFICVGAFVLAALAVLKVAVSSVSGAA